MSPRYVLFTATSITGGREDAADRGRIDVACERDVANRRQGGEKDCKVAEHVRWTTA